jgi:hypothetical protein
MKKYILLLLILLLPVTAWGVIDWQRYDYFDYSGGLNDTFSSIRVADNEATSLQNVVFTNSGSFKTRGGSAKTMTGSTLGATTDTNGIFFYQPTSGAKFLVGVFSDNKIRKMDYATGGGPDGGFDNEKDDITGSLSFSVDQDDVASFAVGEDILIIEDGLNTTAPYKWTGSGDAADLGGSPPNCTMVAYHKRQAWCAGNNSNPSTLYFSDLDDIENWTTALSGNLTIETNDGSEIRAIEPGFDSMYAWKDFSIWRISGDDKDNYELERMVQGIGTKSSDSIQIVGNDFIFTDGQGDTYIYDGGIKVRLISSKIEETMDESNFTRFTKIRTTLFDKDYYLSLSSVGSSTHDTVLVFDTFNLAWTKFSGMNINAMTVGDDDGGEDIIYFGDYTGFVYEYPSGTSDAGTAIDMFYTTKQFRFPEVKQNKTFKVMNVFIKQAGDYNLNVEVRQDFIGTGTSQAVNLSSTDSSFGTAVYGIDAYGGENIIIGRLEYNLEGQFFQIEYSNSNLDEPIEVRGNNVYIEPSDRI